MQIRLRIAILLAASFVIAGAVFVAVGALTYQKAVYQSPAEQTDQLLRELRVSREVAIEYVRRHPETVVDPKFKPDSEFQGQINASINQAFQRVQRRAMDDAVDRSRWWSLVALVAMALGAALAGWAISARALQPLRMVTARARAASGSDLSGRVALDGPHDEIRELGDTFDQMLDRLERAFVAQRRFSSQVSHEIRTPLSIISSETDLLLRDAGDGSAERASLVQIRAAVDRAERIVGSLLVLARSGSGDIAPTDLRLDDLTGDVLGDVVHGSAWHAVRVELDLAAAPMRGDQGLLERLVANLLSNAVRHNRAHDGWVEVRTRVEGEWSVLEIANSVPDRSEDAVDGTPSSGVGLTVVDSVVAAHGGELTWARDEPGAVTVTVRFPVAAALLASAGR
jgi:signal transduction histidine kinase